MDLENKQKYLKYKAKYLNLMDLENLESKNHEQQLLDLDGLRKDDKRTVKDKIMSEKYKIALALMNMHEQDPPPTSLPFAPLPTNLSN